MLADQQQGKGRAAPKRKSHAVETEVDRSTREQYRFIDYCVREKIECTVFTTPGTAFIGIIQAHDREALILTGSSKAAQQRLFQKHFIAMIVPNMPIELFREYRGMGTAKNRRKKRFELRQQQAEINHQGGGIRKLQLAASRTLKASEGAVRIRTKRRIEAPV